MNSLFSKGQGTLLAIIIISAASTPIGASAGWAQQKLRIAGKSHVANTKYTQQKVIDVGDVPGHQIRIFEIHRTFPKDPPVFAGLRTREEWVRGLSDYTNNNGWADVYYTYVLENGDKVFARAKAVTQAIANPDQSKKSTVNVVATITGGTGKVLGIRGVIKSTNVIDPQAGFNEGQFEGEYWLQK